MNKLFFIIALMVTASAYAESDCTYNFSDANADWGGTRPSIITRQILKEKGLIFNKSEEVEFEITLVKQEQDSPKRGYRYVMVRRSGDDSLIFQVTHKPTLNVDKLFLQIPTCEELRSL